MAYTIVTKGSSQDSVGCGYDVDADATQRALVTVGGSLEDSTNDFDRLQAEVREIRGELYSCGDAIATI